MANSERVQKLKSEARARALKGILLYRRVFESPDGKKVLQDLKGAFERKLNVPGDPYATHVRVGNHEVLQYIKEIMENNPNDYEDKDKDD